MHLFAEVELTLANNALVSIDVGEVDSPLDQRSPE